MAHGDPGMAVEVVYALPERQTLVQVRVQAGATAREAVVLSGLPSLYPDIDPVRGKIGIFGRHVPPDTVLRNGDRVEIYRPLTADPKAARRRRARKPK
jgi:putative ubiquitin-RnfH superfamily antitoxin RatB of RatAB toxin-antitoxin module